MHEVHCPAGCTEATSNPKPAFVRWSEHVIEAGIKAGLDFETPRKLRGWLSEAGYEDVAVKWMHWPLGTWAKGAKNKQIGRWWAEDMKDGTKNSSALFTRVLGWKQEDFDEFAAEIGKEINEGKKHLWLEM